MDCSMPGFPVLHYLPEFAQTHALEPVMLSNHLILYCPALDISQHQGLFQWVGSSHQVAKVLEFQLQDQSFQWIFRVDFPATSIFFLKISWWLVADFRILLNVYFREWNPLHFPYQQIMWFHSLSHRLRCLGMLLFITQGHVLLHRTPRGSTQKGAVNIWR